MDNKNYNDALNLLLDNYPRIIPEHLKMKKHFLYNITSCYSILKNKEKTIEYLEKLFEVDNNIWFKIIMNTDLDEFKYTKEFINLMKKAIDIKKTINKNYNLCIIQYLEKYIYN
jgi:tetratricopeptide (TPR) repeat protein